MQLSLKATRFLIEALDYYREHQDQELQQGRLTEDKVSDRVNDLQYLGAIKQDLERHCDELMRQRAKIQSDV
jgi:hypothetical protein